MLCTFLNVSKLFLMLFEKVSNMYDLRLLEPFIIPIHQGLFCLMHPPSQWYSPSSSYTLLQYWHFLISYDSFCKNTLSLLALPNSTMHLLVYCISFSLLCNILYFRSTFSTEYPTLHNRMSNKQYYLITKGY